jgi:hypothetical protein
MLGLSMLNVAIGMTFIFLLLSLICTAISEILEAFLKKRASDLERGITELLRDAKNAKGENLVKKIYEHPLVSGLYRGEYVPKGNKLPSYIPASNFTLALLDAVLPATHQSLSGAVGGGSPVAELPDNKTSNGDAMSKVEIQDNRNVTADGHETPRMGTQDATPINKDAIQINLKSIREAILNLPDSKTKDGILTLIDAAGNDINKARQNVENWYNTTMDRVSGWYKRRLQKILILLGFLLAVAMNADTIAILKVCPLTLLSKFL